MAMKKVKIKWLDQPENHNYPAAFSYLSLLFDEADAKSSVKQLRAAPISEFKAKDIFRASGLSLLGISNSHVESDQQKIITGKKMSPLLLKRDAAHRRVVIADGYHRLCAIYSYHEDALIRCKIV